MDDEMIRHSAATAVFKLALKLDAKAIHRNLSVPPGKGMVKGSDDSGTYHNPQLLRDMIKYLDIALTIYEEPTGLNLKAMYLEILGEYDTAARCYERLMEITKDRVGYTSYPKGAEQGKARCLAKQRGA